MQLHVIKRNRSATLKLEEKKLLFEKVQNTELLFV